MDVRREASNAKSWGAWVGDISRLVRMGELIEHLVAPQVLRHQERKIAEQVDPSGDAEYRASRAEVIRAQAAQAWVVEAEASRKEFSTKERGPFRDVLRRLDPTRTDDLRFRLSGASWEHGTEVEVRFSRTKGCQLAVRGDDPEWVRAVFTTLEEEVRTGVPPWGVLRKDTHAINVWWVVIPLLAFSLPIGITLAIRGGFGILGNILLLYVPPAVSWLPLGVLLKRVFPGFEITAPGSTGRGGRLLLATAAFISNVVASIVATIILTS